MIFVSTSCIKAASIGEVIRALAEEGFRNIELSGGTSYSETLAADLKSLRDRYHLRFLLHNYFPPPKKDFVLNLSSADQESRQRSIEHLLRALALSRDLGADQFAFHSGFFVELQVGELGRTAARRGVHERQAAIERFCEGYEAVARAADGVRLYIENNALSIDHAAAFRDRKPFMLLDSEDARELRQRLTFRLLLDVGHLKVSTQTLGLSFERECDTLIDGTDYLHISDNDGLRDLSAGVRRGSPMATYLATKNLQNKTVTLEIYEGMPQIRETYELMEELTR